MTTDTLITILVIGIAFILGPAIALVLFKPLFQGLLNGIERVVLAVIRIFGGRWKEAWADPDLELWRHLKTRAFSTGDFSLQIVVEPEEPDGLDRLREFFRSGIEYITVLVLLDYIPGEQDESMATDKSALSVGLALETIGYLTRDDSERYRRAIEVWKSAGYLVRCRARLAGGDHCESISVWLDLDTPEAIAAALHDPKTKGRRDP